MSNFEILSNCGNTANLKYTHYVRDNSIWKKITFKDFVLSNAVTFGMRTIFNYFYEDEYYCDVKFVRVIKTNPKENKQYIVKLISSDLNIVNKSIACDDGTWHLIHEYQKHDPESYSFTLKLILEVVPEVTFNSFAPLHDDEELTDFALNSEDGAVRIHKAVLAAASPVFRRMLSGAWKETAKGYADIPGTSKNALQDLKNYVYLNTLPETGSEQLLLLASCYMMPELERKCVDKLVNTLTAQNTYDLLKFAIKNELTQLVLAILEAVRNDKVQVDAIKLHMLGSSSEPCLSVSK